ncbi:c-type cytochrome [Paenibacillus oryzisoli]|uniref:Cytochrome c domain-containing protein n=1 Tax=Paenibacillus oryzisoli TaxID=1850517 RepID=A0A198A919_9BACL|nr:cytochrome c [Paenibacillus oryzisoli]OAS17662.1 hypothetical protein A8708_15680 [Paenibacillus oryzisoli]
MNKWMYASIFVIVILAATGCSKQEAQPVVSSPSPTAVSVASSPTPAPAATVAPATPTPVATATTAATVAPTASVSPAPSAAEAPKPQATVTAATPAPVATATPVVATPAPTPAPVATPSPAPTAKPQATVSAADSSEQAQQLYKSNCLSCHGAGLKGDYGPNLTKVGARRTKEQITAQIMNGKVEMPPFKDSLKADEVEALAVWLAAMK